MATERLGVVGRERGEFGRRRIGRCPVSDYCGMRASDWGFWVKSSDGRGSFIGGGALGQGIHQKEGNHREGWLLQRRGEVRKEEGEKERGKGQSVGPKCQRRKEKGKESEAYAKGARARARGVGLTWHCRSSGLRPFCF